MLETVAFDARKVQDRGIIDTPHCGCATASEEVANLAKDSSSLDLTNIVLAPSKVSACDPALAFRQEIEGSCRATLANHDILGKLL